MSADIIMDLHADFASACAKELQAAGYSPPTGPAAEIIRSYANVRNRRVPQRPRRVHKAAYSVPAHLVAGEQAFLSAVAVGADLRPYQSTRLEKADFNDGMLNDFGIQHFHLGIGQHPTKPGFMARTEPVLFALVRDDDFYSLGCYVHGAWSQIGLLDLIHAIWPDVIASNSPNRAPDSSTSTPGLRILGLRHNYTDDEVEMLRKAGINALTQRPDGTIHVGPGGGVTTDGKSGKVSREVTTIKGLCERVERDLKDLLAPMLASGELSSPVTLQLQQRGADTFAVVDGNRGEFDLGRRLFVPPL
ncbi:hypothetical protein ASE04_14350 [Rhizobium sp. Root708]|uniref:hypothetical protein n=1 Tax=Rhizobium sp. Root708 TaxID=1736592 RepID=UPI0006F8F4DD|nr:hypothetical protein [Rhizobium sp. Root708]KRB49790.1 hypothetical protein ASE04_14350 [Rhizobium sp. Root708]